MQLNYKVFGEGEPVIILHGLLGSLDNWQTLVRKMGEQYQVYIIDQRNHGKSPHTDHHSYQLMADDLLEFIDQQGIAKANLIGHSMGGKVVMQFAVDHPDRVERQVIVDIAPKQYGRHHDTIFHALMGLDLSALSSRNDADEALKQDIPEFGVRQFLMKNLSRTPEGFKWKPNLQVLWDDYDDVSIGIESNHQLDIPTLVIRGGQSGYITVDDIDLFEALFTDVELVTIEHAGHWVHAEAPEELLRLVQLFMLS